MKWIGLVIAVFVAVAAAFMVMKMSGNDEQPVSVQATQQPMDVQPQAQVQIQTVNVYVAAKFIPIGTVIDESMLDTQPWPQHLVLDGFVVGPEAGEKLKGMVTRAPFQAREPIIGSKVVNPEDPNFLAGALPKGKRVITMATDEIAGVAGFVFPGDRVDVLVTHRILREDVTQKDIKEAGNMQELTEEVTESLVTNIPVLAVDQRSTAGAAVPSGGSGQEGGIVIPRSISLEVTPEDAQRIRLGYQLGQLSLTLRSLEDKETIETVAITRQTDLSQFDTSALAASSNSDEFIPVVVIRGTAIENEDAKKKRDEARDTNSRTSATQ